MENTPSRGKIPAFFKVFIPEYCSNRLQFPDSFTSYMKLRLPEGASFLRNRHGNIWQVDVTREGNHFYFENGWVKFVEDNCVEMGHFLTFQFTGDLFFDFKHLDTSACEKAIIEPFKFTVKLEDLDREREVEERHDEEGDEEMEKYDDEEEEYVVDEEDGEDEEYDEEETEEVEDDEDEENIVSKGDRRRGVDIFESGLIGRPKNPYFVAQVQIKRNELYIPSEVVKDHNLEIPRGIIIFGEDGKEFHSRINTWADGRNRVTNGWRAFCRWYPLKEDDRCLCEFVKSDKLFIRVLHFRAGKWMPRSRS